MFAQFMQRIAAGIHPTHAQAALRAVHGRGASRWLADYAGISPRTARRWLSDAYPRGRAAAITEAARAASVPAAAAARIRTAEQILIDGPVEVYYVGEPQGQRNIGDLTVTPAMAAYLDRCATDLESGKLEAAAEAFSNAVMNGYEVGLENTLAIEDFDTIDIAP